MTLTGLVAIIGAATGIAGTVFGIVNTMHIVSVDKIRLRVIPEYSFALLIDEVIKGFTVEVQNLSYMPITVKNVEILLSDGSKLAIGVDLMKVRALPVRIPARESVSFPIVGFHVSNADLDTFIAKNAKLLSQAEYIAVKTGGGLVFKGTSEAFKDIVRKARAVAKNRT